MSRNLSDLHDRRRAEYSELISNFISNIKDLDLTGIEEPHLPVLGADYEHARYKIAFCGMETKGWGPLSEFVKKEPEDLVTYADYTLNELEYLGWAKNYHATFWGFVLKFLAKFYNVSVAELTERKHPEILRSFLWTNVNSIERFDVSAQKQNGNLDTWKKVKEASIPFDNLNHVLNSARPKVVIILYSGAQEKYFLDLSDSNYGLDIWDKTNYMFVKDEDYRYYYRRDTGTHIFCMSHPRYMGAYSGKSIDAYVDSLMAALKKFNVWPSLPAGVSDWNSNPVQKPSKNSMPYKREFIANLAQFLVENNLVMSGRELQELLNRNDIMTSYGCRYGYDGGRGIHRLISNVWAHYHGKGDFQTAYNISRAFVNQKGEYAYDY